MNFICMLALQVMQLQHETKTTFRTENNEYILF